MDGNATVELTFDVEDINDLLKSMVVQDFGGGRVTTVQYASRNPIERTLKTFAVDLTTNPSIADLLNQVRGEKVAVFTPNRIEGTILGVETRTIKVDDEQINVEKLTLLTETGLRSIDMSSVQRIELLRPELQAELNQALAVLATGHDSDKKKVALKFVGRGQREVRVGYIAESPIWKTSYRIVVQDKGNLLLQGWAIVENPSEEDWKDVDLTLVSGRPISFRMDLYQPLFVSRPLVEPELYASLRPQVYDDDLRREEAKFKKLADKDGDAKADFGYLQRQNRAREQASAAGRPARDEAMELDALTGQSMAQAEDVGELFRYTIDTPVSIARRQSAMLPIANETEKVSIYNESVQAKHPLNGLRIKNSTGLHLNQGPITVFDGGIYAGDAQIQDLPPGTERLISYALDLDTEVAPEGKNVPEKMLTIRLFKGQLIVNREAEQGRKYVVKNSGSKAKKVLIEYPKHGGWNLLSPKKDTAEETRDQYRFAVTAEPGKATTLEVREQRTYDQAVVLSNLNDDTILYYINRPITSQAVKDALDKVIDMKQDLSEVRQQKARLEQELAAIEAEQNRIRRNMPQLDKTSELYARYVKKFNDQEDRIEQIRGEVAKLEKTEAAKQKALDTFLMNLDVK